ncbi:hypothetical protein A5780_21700 [Nocardia sp. 852002-20019_SCH5090214]|jgi:hypothetical protein|uniref:Uncharacterized protein n=1 Tax=Nocardia nova TaxID=37330 RepID=A0A2S5ZVE9_9NOCA|nr:MULTISPECIES: hypothetical protein [Nocardia]OBF76961.1 hypothetical protein A9X06_24105 [Mycobacterium sp. 852002-51759_SCH5129042]MBF6272462.1 hypothetical protein [Nocardia nova]OBA40527.1 hypothetical protein A5789_17525 [Nocardia sp. 852002-51101_SCH5132738]OBA58121.1 hypothetical protein A5780_21700 [Nocardia sp. 852002-20019_SCH5090214]OBB42937.1 hypothetical protein A5748_29430 [Nocardia sp. 852002-51244_SCH5132740]
MLVTLNVSTDASVDKILDEGCTGLMFFQEYLPRYAQVNKLLGFGRAEMPSYESLCAKYDTERGMDLAALDGVAQDLSRVVGEADTELELQKTQLGAVQSIWQGTAGDDAHALLDQQVRRAQTDYDQVKQVSLGLAFAPGSLRNAVLGKAEAVKKYWKDDGPDFDGSAGRQKIDWMIMVAAEYKNPGSYAPVVSMQIAKQYGPTATDWLRTVFVKGVEDTVQSFNDLCARTKSTIEQLYGGISDALDRLDVSAYPMPAGTPQPSQPSNPGPSPSNPGPAPANPGPAPANSVPSNQSTPGNTVPSSVSPTVTSGLDGLAQISQVASQLSPVVSTLGQSLTQGATALSTAIQQGFDGALQQVQSLLQPHDAKGAADGKPNAEFDIAGRHLKFEMGPNGELKVVMSDSSGDEKTYSMKLDEHGNPVINTEDKKPGAEGDAGHPGDSPAGDGQPFGEGQQPGDGRKPDDTEQKQDSGVGKPGNDDQAPPPPKPTDQQPPAGGGQSSENGGSQANPVNPATPPPPRRDSETDHKPPAVPPQGPPPDPNGSGAELAEAGPL